MKRVTKDKKGARPAGDAKKVDNKKRASSKLQINLPKIRHEAREAVMDGAITPSYHLDKKEAVKILNSALATEIVCMLRYRRHAFMAKGPNSEPISKEFLAHATEELGHADMIAERIVQLGGEPDLDPSRLQIQSHADYVEGKNLKDMIRENLVAERIAIESYRAMINWFGEKDTSTRRLLESILAVEEEHADELVDLLDT